MTQHQNVGVRSFMQALSRYGDWPEHIGLGLVLIAIAYWRGSKSWVRIFFAVVIACAVGGIFAAMIIACALAGISTRVVKISTGRARPNVQSEAEWNGPKLSPRYNAFPSGHTPASTAFFATLAFVSWRVGAGFLLVPLL